MAEYEDGDINEVDEAAEVDDAVCFEVTEYIVKALSNDPEAVEVSGDHRNGVTKLSVRVNPDDMGRIIGRRGRTAQAIRSLVGVAGAQAGVKTNVDIVDD